MNLVLLIYLIELVDNVRYTLMGILTFSPFAVGLGFLILTDVYEPHHISKRYPRVLKAFFASWLSALILLTITPKKETVQLMVGVYIGQEIIAEPKTKELLGESYNVLLNGIKKLNKELTNESK